MASKNCPHIKSILPCHSVEQFYGTKISCHSCGHTSTNQWLCLASQCKFIGCGHRHQDHSSKHAKAETHPLAVNLHNRKVFCHLCNEQVHFPTVILSPPAESLSSPSPSNATRTAQSYKCNGSLKDGNEDGKIYSHSTTVRPTPDDKFPTFKKDNSENACYPNYEEPSRNTSGLRNLDNTCYMNASLQALMFCHPLNHVFLDGPIIPSYPRRLNLAVIFQKLFQEMWCSERKSNENRTAVPSQLLTVFRTLNPTFRSYAQQDAQEFIRLFIDRLHEELKEPLSRSAAQKCGNATLPLSVNVYERRRTHSISSGNGNSTSHIPRQRHASSRSSVGSNADYGVDKDTLDNEVLNYRSIISDIFRGTLRNTCECLECGFTSTTFEPFYDLSVPILKSASPNKSSAATNSSYSSYWPLSYLPSSGGSQLYDIRTWMSWITNYMKSWFIPSKANLQDCLDLFFAEDNLLQDNQYFCERCNKLCDGVKRSAVEHLPEVLCVHLKRFHHQNSSSGSTMRFQGLGDSFSGSSKLTDPIVFPLFGLDMTPYTTAGSSGRESTTTSTHGDDDAKIHNEYCKKEQCIYDLSAVVCHLGHSGNYGHYITYALNQDMQQWFEMDDESIQPCDALTVASMLTQAYVLFYRKNDDAILPLRDAACAIERRDLSNSSYTASLRRSVLPLYIDREWVLKFNSFSHPGLISNARLLCAKHQELLPSLQQRYASLTDSASAIPLTDILLPVSPDLWNFFRNRFSGGPAISSLHVCCKCQKAEELLRERRSKEREFVTKSLGEFRSHGSHGNVYAIHMDWFNAWENFINGVNNNLPGVIINVPTSEKITELFSKDDVIMPPHAALLVEVGNYGKLSEDVWKYLHQIYGGGPTILLEESSSPSLKRAREFFQTAASHSDSVCDQELPNADCDDDNQNHILDTTPLVM